MGTISVVALLFERSLRRSWAAVKRRQHALEIRLTHDASTGRQSLQFDSHYLPLTDQSFADSWYKIIPRDRPDAA